MEIEPGTSLPLSRDRHFIHRANTALYINAFQVIASHIIVHARHRIRYQCNAPHIIALHVNASHIIALQVNASHITTLSVNASHFTALRVITSHITCIARHCIAHHRVARQCTAHQWHHNIARHWNARPILTRTPSLFTCLYQSHSPLHLSDSSIFSTLRLWTEPKLANYISL